jgi:hypothetical protein
MRHPSKVSLFFVHVEIEKVEQALCAREKKKEINLLYQQQKKVELCAEDPHECLFV